MERAHAFLTLSCAFAAKHLGDDGVGIGEHVIFHRRLSCFTFPQVILKHCRDAIHGCRVSDESYNQTLDGVNEFYMYN